KGLDKDLMPTDEELKEVVANTEGFSFAYLRELFLVGLMQWIDDKQAGKVKTLGAGMVKNAKQLLEEQEQGLLIEEPSGEDESMFPGLEHLPPHMRKRFKKFF